VPPADPFERELRERELGEDPRARAARLANQRWVTQRRLWAALDREGITEPGARARFICDRLWPDLRPDVVERYVAAVREQFAGGHPLRRPIRASDVVGARLEQLMADHGYPIGPGDDEPDPADRRPQPPPSTG
jgi:hypothetical protein